MQLARAQRQRHVQVDGELEDADDLRRLALEDARIDRLQRAIAHDEVRVGGLPPSRSPSTITGWVLRRFSSRTDARWSSRSVSLRISLAWAWYWCISASTAGWTAGRMTPPRSRASGYRIGAIPSCSAKRRWSCRRPPSRASAMRTRISHSVAAVNACARRPVITPWASSCSDRDVPKRAIAAQRPTHRSRMPPGPFLRSGSSRKIVSPKRL